MPIQIVASSSFATTATTTPLATSWPAAYTPVSGDFALVVVSGRPSSQSPPTASVAGWTFRTGSYTEAGTNDVAVYTLYRFLTGSDAAPAINAPAPWQGNTTAGMGAHIIVLRNVLPSSPFDTTDVIGTSTATGSFRPLGITTTTDDTQIWSIVSTADDNALRLLAGAEAGFTAFNSGTAYHTTTGGDFAVGTAYYNQSLAGAKTAPTWSQSAGTSAAWASITLALRGVPLTGSGATGFSGTALLYNTGSSVDYDLPFTVVGRFRLAGIPADSEHRATLWYMDANSNLTGSNLNSEYLYVDIDGTLVIRGQDAGGANEVLERGATVLSANTNYHFAYVNNGTNRFFYLNGNSTPEITAASSVATRPTTTRFFIGGRPDGLAYISGGISDYAVTQSALTTTQVAQVYNSGAVALSNWWGRWPLTNFSQNPVQDSSGNSRHLTVSGTLLDASQPAIPTTGSGGGGGGVFIYLGQVYPRYDTAMQNEGQIYPRISPVV